MYEFYFGTKEEVLQNEEEYLLFVKRLLPRWANGIPDSEFLAIYNILKNIDFDSDKPPVFVETGSGASSIVLFYFAVKHGGKVYSWDTNGSKASFLKTVVSENIAKLFGVNPYSYWKFIEFHSCDPYLGIPILGELAEEVDFCFLDSWHTWDNVESEISLLLPYLKSNSIVALDDANYKNKSYNYQFVNIFRTKMGLPKVVEPKENICEPYFVEAEKLFERKGIKFKKIKDTYKENYLNDIFFQYYSTDKRVMGELGMERNDERDHRFDAWSLKCLD